MEYKDIQYAERELPKQKLEHHVRTSYTKLNQVNRSTELVVAVQQWQSINPILGHVLSGAG